MVEFTQPHQTQTNHIRAQQTANPVHASTAILGGVLCPAIYSNKEDLLYGGDGPDQVRKHLDPLHPLSDRLNLYTSSFLEQDSETRRQKAGIEERSFSPPAPLVTSAERKMP